MADELLDELAESGFDVGPGDLGENVLTRGIDLLGLPTGAVLRLGRAATVRVTGLRNPCAQIDRFRPGPLRLPAARAADGSIERRAGVMGVVLVGGLVRAGEPIGVTLPPEPHRPLDKVGRDPAAACVRRRP